VGVAPSHVRPKTTRFVTALAALMSRRRARELLKWWLSMMERVAVSGLDDARQFLLLNLIQPYFELAGSERKKLERLLSRDRHQEVSSLPGPRRLRRRPAGKARRRACSKARRTPLCANSQPSSVRSRKPRPEYGRLSPPRSLSATWTELSSQLACGHGPSRLSGRPRPSNSSRRFERQGTHGCAGASDSVGRGPRDVHSSVAWPRYLGGAARSAHPSITRQHTVYFRYNYGYTDKMKTAISIPDPLFDAADEVADRLGMSRSQLYAKAVAEYVEKHRDDQVTEALNQVYAKYSSTLDPVLAAMQSMSLPREEW